MPKALPLKRLTKEQKRFLNALLNVYEAYKDLVALYLEDVSKSHGDLEVLYIRKLVPEIRELAGTLPIELPKDLIPFETLSHAGATLLERGWTADTMRSHVFGMFGDLKLLANRSGAVAQLPIPQARDVIEETQKAIDAIRNGVPITVDEMPCVGNENGWVCMTFGKSKPIRLFKEATLYGSLLSILGDPWGVPHSKDMVLEDIERKTGKQRTPKQVEDAAKELNRRMKEKGVPPVEIISRENTWQIAFRATPR